MGDTLMFEVGRKADFVENAGNEIGFGNIVRPIQRTASKARISTLTDTFSDQQNTDILQAGVQNNFQAVNSLFKVFQGSFWAIVLRRPMKSEQRQDPMHLHIHNRMP